MVQYEHESLMHETNPSSMPDQDIDMELVPVPQMDSELLPVPDIETDLKLEVQDMESYPMLEVPDMESDLMLEVPDTESDLMLEVPDPNWILDRRNSGNLFWRRDDCDSSRVRFRYDVDVQEFLRSESELDDEYSSDDEDDSSHRRSHRSWRRRNSWDTEIPPPSNLWGGVCVIAIAAIITYQWFSVYS